MGLKTFDELGNVGFSKSWQDENKDLILEMKAGEVRELRFINAFLPMALHWVPFISKKGSSGKIRFFPQMCLKWDLERSEMDDEARCPACDRDIHANENAVFWVIDVDALYNGDKKRAVKIFEVGSRERKKLSNLAKFNKVKGTPHHIGHDRYGRIVQVNFDPNNTDKSLRWMFSKGDRLPVKLSDNSTTLKVRIPEDAESDYAGKVFTFELESLFDIVKTPDFSDTKQKFARMKVDEALARLDDDDSGDRRERRGKRNDDDDRSSRRGKKQSPRRRPRDEDDDDDDDDRSSRRRRGRRSRDEDADPEEDDFGDEDGGDEDDGGEEKEDRTRRRSSKKKSSSKKGKSSRRSRDDDDDPEDDWGEDEENGGDDEPADDEGGDDDDDRPSRRPNRGRDRNSKSSRSSGRGKRSSRRSSRRSRDEDEDDSEEEDKAHCNKKSDRGDRCALHKRCFGSIGEEDTEDCTICCHRDECLDANQADDDD